ncbi:hypothetical protein ACCO45_001867 [Purpureocillium lilacinum]|uniref:Uncharacterized protein n=1 Tax=Purpureocillium lilacinum TaxID=33203 RepID=A0ACC4E9H6_PURLI
MRVAAGMDSMEAPMQDFRGQGGAWMGFLRKRATASTTKTQQSISNEQQEYKDPSMAGLQPFAVPDDVPGDFSMPGVLPTGEIPGSGFGYHGAEDLIPPHDSLCNTAGQETGSRNVIPQDDGFQSSASWYCGSQNGGSAPGLVSGGTFGFDIDVDGFPPANLPYTPGDMGWNNAFRPLPSYPLQQAEPVLSIAGAGAVHPSDGPCVQLPLGQLPVQQPIHWAGQWGAQQPAVQSSPTSFPAFVHSDFLGFPSHHPPPPLPPRTSYFTAPLTALPSKHAATCGRRISLWAPALARKVKRWRQYSRPELPWLVECQSAFAALPTSRSSLPYGAPNVDHEGNPTPSYPPVEVAALPVPAYGNPTAGEDFPAELIAVPCTAEQFDAYPKITGEIESPGLLLDLAEPAAQNKTEVAQNTSAQSNQSKKSNQSKIPLDPRIKSRAAQGATSTQVQTAKKAATPRDTTPARQNIPAVVSQAVSSQTITASAGLGSNTQWPQPLHALVPPQSQQPAAQTGVIGQDGTYCPQGPLVVAGCGLGTALPTTFGKANASHDIKVDNSRNAKKNKDPNSSPSRVYTAPIYPNPPFGPLLAENRRLFTYTPNCQLTAGRAFTSEELRQYVDSRRCIMWVQQAPSQCAGRMDPDDKRCRWASCPINARSISSGWLRVALDEFPNLTSDGTKDPFKVAGLLHLWCFEQIFDPMEFYTTCRLFPDARQLPKETVNAMAINRETDRDIVEECYIKWFQDHEEEYNQHGAVTQPREHQKSLSYALIKYHLDNQTTARQKARASRNQDKATDRQKTIDVHVGDLSLYARVSKNCRATAKLAQSQQTQEDIIVDDDGDTTSGDNMSIGWSPAAEDVTTTESNSSPVTDQEMPPPISKATKVARTRNVFETPSKPTTSRNATNLKINIPGTTSNTMERPGKNKATDDVDMSDFVADEATKDVPRFDLLNPDSWKEKTPAPASPIEQYFNPLSSPLAGIAAPAVMQTSLSSPVVRGSIVARGLTAQQALLAKAQERHRRKSAATQGVTPQQPSLQGGSKRKRDEEHMEPGCVSDDRRPAKMQHLDQPSLKRKRHEDDMTETSPSPKRRRSEIDLTAPNLMGQQQANVLSAQAAESVAPVAAQVTQQTTGAAIVATNEPNAPNTSSNNQPDNVSEGIAEFPDMHGMKTLDSLFEGSAADLDVDSLVETFEWPQ